MHHKMYSHSANQDRYDKACKMDQQIQLIKINHKHRAFLQTLLNEPSVALFNDFTLPVSDQDTFEFIQFDIESQLQHRGCRYVIYYQNIAVGTCGGHIENDVFKLGYELKSEYRGKGIMTYALKVLFKIIKQQLNCCHLIAYCHSDNKASLNLLNHFDFEAVALDKDRNQIFTLTI